MLEFVANYYWEIMTGLFVAGAALGLHHARNPDNFLRRLSGALFPPHDK